MPSHRVSAFVSPRSLRPLYSGHLGPADVREIEKNRGKSMAVFPFTETVLTSDDKRTVYPVIEDIPVLLVPEMGSISRHEIVACNAIDPRYAEAYEEMGHYESVAKKQLQGIRDSNAYLNLSGCVGLSEEEQLRFPKPHSRWLEATYDVRAQAQVFAYLAPILGKEVVQIGGTGVHALRFLLAGARHAGLITPMLGEARFARALAIELGVSDRFSAAVGIFEECPLPDHSVDVVFSGGSLHHTITDLAFVEARRILRPGGRLGCFDPWRAPFYRLAVKLLGKREPGVFCRPLENERLRYLSKCFGETQVKLHGALTRYPLLALQKLGIDFTTDGGSGYSRVVDAIMAADDALSSLVPPLRLFASSVSVCATQSLGTKNADETTCVDLSSQISEYSSTYHRSTKQYGA